MAEKMNLLQVAVSIAVILAVLHITGIYQFSGAQTTGAGQQITISNQPAGGVSGIVMNDKTTVTLTSYNTYQPTTAANNEGALVYEDGVSSNVSIASGTYDTSPLTSNTIYFGRNDEQGSVYTVKVVEPIPDKGEYPIRQDLCTIDTEPSISILDKYGQLQSGSTNAWSIGSSEEYVGEIKIQAAADKCYGNPTASIDNVICFLGNTSIYKSLELVGQPSVGMPNTMNNNVSSKRTSWCFTFPKIADNAIWSGQIKVAAKSSQNPTSTDGILLITDDAGITLSADTEKDIEGYEDEAGNALGDAVNVNSPRISIS